MLINHSVAGYSAHCFKCKTHPYEPKGERSLRDLKKERDELAAMQSKTIRIPYDTDYIGTYGVPNEAYWFLKYGVSFEDAIDYDFGYSAFFDRIVIPVRDPSGELLAVQMRDYTGKNPPKWLSSSNKGKPAMFYSHPHADTETETVVLVEDIISAIKVGKVTPAIAIIGSNIGDIRAMQIACRYAKAIIWLDGDKAGRLGALDMEKQLVLQGMTDIHRICTEKDPKEYSLDEIRKQVECLI